MAVSATQRLPGIQALRGLAAVAVVFVHAITRASTLYPDQSRPSVFRTATGGQWTVGDAGVDLFFAISGFIMLRIHWKDFGRPGARRDFIWKRILRVIPLYWLVTTLTLLLLVALPTLLSNHHPIGDGAWIVTSYLLLPYPGPFGTVSPVVGVGWTLVYEAFFYVIFVCALGMSGRNGLCVLIGLLGGLVIIGFCAQPTGFLLKFLTSWLLLDFLAGILVARFTLEGHRLGSAYRAILIGASVLTIAVTAIWPPPEQGFTRFLVWGLPTAALVLALHDVAFPGQRLWTCLGDASYSIYLVQTLALPAWGLVLKKTIASHTPVDLVIAVLVTLVTLSGILCWTFIERPLTAAVRAITTGLVSHRRATAVETLDTADGLRR